MKRTQVNFAIDAAAFTAFLFLLSTGLLLRYQLPPGSGQLQGAGQGRGASERPITHVWSWTRHEWGELHYWIAAVLVAVLAVHVVLHWKWIVCVVRGTRNEASGLRFGLGVASLAALGLMVAAPLMAPTERATRGELQQEKTSDSQVLERFSHTTDLRGSMTVSEAAEELGLSAGELLSRLNLPTDTLSTERIGRLLRQHGLQMSDVRQSLRESSAETHGRTDE